MKEILTGHDKLGFYKVHPDIDKKIRLVEQNNGTLVFDNRALAEKRAENRARVQKLNGSLRR